ncbi:hypothetical protein ABT072_44230 [Streptomyces sp. NPDC002589]|uniref:DUF6042 family protein n=1 Tax=Streptomyces sp. NPDC002589 TaxID=3154420 RepID=UPI00331E6E53
MSTTSVSTLPNIATPTAAEVFAFADLEIGAAATEQWPHADLDVGDQVPSVTGYVRRIHVDGRPSPEGREPCEAARWEQSSTMLTTARFPVPTTVRDLSELYLTWGLARREETPDGT